MTVNDPIITPKSLMELDHHALLQVLRRFFAEHGQGLICAYLFGSTARGTANTHSDIDLALLYAESPPDTLEGLGIDVAVALQQRLHRPVDCVVLNRAPVDLIHRVLRDGILVYEQDRSRRIRFEVQARNAYFDLLPVLRQYRKARDIKT